MYFKHFTAVLSAFALLATTATAGAEIPLEARLQDGRRVLLNPDGTYEMQGGSRSIVVRLKSLGAPTGFMSDARRDCGIVFELENNLGGELISIRTGLSILDRTGAKVLQGGVMNYSIDLISFDPANLMDGQSKVMTVDAEISCSDIAEIQVTDIEEKYCNFVGRQPDDKCKSMLKIESAVQGLNFKM